MPGFPAPSFAPLDVTSDAPGVTQNSLSAAAQE